MANRRCLHALTRHASSLFPKTHPLRLAVAVAQPQIKTLTTSAALRSTNSDSSRLDHFSQARRFSSGGVSNGGDSEEDEEEEWESGDDEEEDDDDDVVPSRSGVSERNYTPEQKAAEAAEIGYTVFGPLDKSDSVFKPYEPVFAIVQIGSHQFKVSNEDCIFVERLKFCEVNDKLSLDKVLLLGSRSQTIIGRPTVPNATVHAVVEEHALNAKVIIFKKKRRKNYRRAKGHRQELTKLRITDIQGIEKPEPVNQPKPTETPPDEKPEKVAVAA